MSEEVPPALRAARSAVLFALISAVIAALSGGVATLFAGQGLFTPNDGSTAVTRIGAIFNRIDAPVLPLWAGVAVMATLLLTVVVIAFVTKQRLQRDPARSGTVLGVLVGASALSAIALLALSFAHMNGTAVIHEYWPGAMAGGCVGFGGAWCGFVWVRHAAALRALPPAEVGGAGAAPSEPPA